MMNLKITFINPNSEQEVDKYLPKILAAAVINKIAGSRPDGHMEDKDGDVEHPA